MRVVTWNCRSGTDAKLPAVLDAYQPDLLVLPESSKVPRRTAPTLLSAGVPHAWTGTVPSKGLGVFAPGARSLSVTPAPEGQGDWSLAVNVATDHWEASLLAIWTVPLSGGAWRSKYLSALDGVFARHQGLLSNGTTIVAGDFNCCGTRDSDELPLFLERASDRFGLHSAYHASTGEPLGRESAMTHWWRGHATTALHIDFVLVPTSTIVSDVTVGTYERWGAVDAPARSDHAPLVVDIDR